MQQNHPNPFRATYCRVVIGLSFVISHLSFSPVAAQTTFTQRLQQPANNGGRVTVTHSSAIDRLVNGRSAGTPAVATGAQPTQPAASVQQPATPSPQPMASTPQPTAPATKPAVPSPQPVVSATQPAASSPRVDYRRDSVKTVPHVPDVPVGGSQKKVLKGGVKVTGYRVQAFAGGNQRKDRVKAEQVAAAIKASFPNEPVYTHFYSPRWICRVGNYRTYEEAREMLQNIRKLGYDSATIVKGKITVPKYSITDESGD